MLKKRIIPCLDIKNGRTVKGTNFVNLRDVGDPVELAKIYVQQGADELVFLDITATVEKRKTLLPLVERIAREIDIPFTVGGGVRTIEDVAALVNAGADKISINSVAVKQPEFITEVASRFGSQCVVVAIDTNVAGKVWKVFVEGGRRETELETVAWAKEAGERGAGEILLTSMANDGTKAGFALALTAAVSEAVNIPVIASGGAGNAVHFLDVFRKTGANAALAASIFHLGEVTIPELKVYLKAQNEPVR
jgi:cyclase